MPCTQLSDPWKQFCQQRRGNDGNVVVGVGGNCDVTDVRVIHPLVSKDNIQRKHAETNKVHVPSNNRAPNFQVFLRPLAIYCACVFHNMYMLCISARGGG